MNEPVVTGNAALSSSISVALIDSFSEALVTAFAACDDENDPLSLHQQRQVVSSCMSVAIGLSTKIEHLLDLDILTRDLLGESPQIIEIEIVDD